MAINPLLVVVCTIPSSFERPIQQTNSETSLNLVVLICYQIFALLYSKPTRSLEIKGNRNIEIHQ